MIRAPWSRSSGDRFARERACPGPQRSRGRGACGLSLVLQTPLPPGGHRCPASWPVARSGTGVSIAAVDRGDAASITGGLSRAPWTSDRTSRREARDRPRRVLPAGAGRRPRLPRHIRAGHASRRVGRGDLCARSTTAALGRPAGALVPGARPYARPAPLIRPAVTPPVRHPEHPATGLAAPGSAGPPAHVRRGDRHVRVDGPPAARQGSGRDRLVRASLRDGAQFPWPFCYVAARPPDQGGWPLWHGTPGALGPTGPSRQRD